MRRPSMQDAIVAAGIALCAAALMSATPSQASGNMAGASAAAAPSAGSDDALYRALGEKAGIAALMNDFASRLKTDPRMAPFFKDSKQQQIANQLTDQICGLAGGPCIYDGATMKDAHADVGVARADFNALVEVLQDAMAARQLPFATQNQLLARLAPMHRDIITK